MWFLEIYTAADQNYYTADDERITPPARYIYTEAIKNRIMKYPVPLIALFLSAAVSCGPRRQVQDTPEAILAQMRTDTTWIHQLDSMAQTAIGPGARCLDPVSHSFLYEGRTFLFNQDWGGVLEIPSDYVIEDDLWQAGLSFHGTRAWSPDSLILVSFYAGFQGVTNEESLEATVSTLAEDGFTVQDREEEQKVTAIRARSAEGINYYGRHIGTNGNGVGYSVSVQWPDNKADEAVRVIKMADRYPAGPSGIVFKGESFR